MWETWVSLRVLSNDVTPSKDTKSGIVYSGFCHFPPKKRWFFFVIPAFTATTATPLPHRNQQSHRRLHRLWQCGSENHEKKGSASI